MSGQLLAVMLRDKSGRSLALDHAAPSRDLQAWGVTRPRPHAVDPLLMGCTHILVSV